MKQMGVGMAPVVVGTAMQVAALEYLIKKLNTDIIHPISQIEMDDTGIRIHAGVTNSEGMLNTGIQMGIGADGNDYTSYISIYPDGASKTIEINNADLFSIKMDQGTSVVIDHIGGTGGQLIINDTGASLEKKNDGGKLTLGTHGATLGISNGGTVTLNANQAQIAKGTSSVTCTGEKVKLAFTEMVAGALSINASGVIKMG